MTENFNQDELVKTARRAGRTLLKRGRNALQRGNTRHLVIRQENGDKLVEVSVLTAGLLLVFVMVVAWWLLPLIALGGIMAKWRVEVLRELSADDKIIEIDTEKEA